VGDESDNVDGQTSTHSDRQVQQNVGDKGWGENTTGAVLLFLIQTKNKSKQ